MRKAIISFVGVLLIGTLSLTPLRHLVFPDDHDYEEYEAEEEEEENEGSVAKQFSYLFQARAYPDPYNISDKYLRGWEQAEALRNRQVAARGNGIQSGCGMLLARTIHPADAFFP